MPRPRRSFQFPEPPAGTTGARILEGFDLLEIESFRDLARAVGVTSSSVRRWVTNVCDPFGQHMAALCRVYGCDEAWILTGKGIPPSKKRGSYSPSKKWKQRKGKPAPAAADNGSALPSSSFQAHYRQLIQLGYTKEEAVERAAIVELESRR